MVEITPMRTPEDAAAFGRLNEVWISELFAIEAADRATLDDPFTAIVDRGGDVLMAREDGVAIGTVALVPTGDGVFELSKMTVATTHRGRGIGRLLMDAAVDRAREVGAASLFLGSNSVLGPAVGLYESVGFRHVPREEIGPLPYTRADVFMELAL